MIDWKLRFLKDIQAQVHSMVELMDDMLTIGKAHASRTQSNPMLMDAKAFAKTILQQQQP